MTSGAEQVPCHLDRSIGTTNGAVLACVAIRVPGPYHEEQPMNYLTRPTTPEMQCWCSILCEEMLRWPGVKMCNVFGTCAFYHRKVMFAVLPGNRSLDSFTAILFRGTAGPLAAQDEKWHTFELTTGDLLNDALATLEMAYANSSLRLPAEPSHSSDSGRTSLAFGATRNTLTM